MCWKRQRDHLVTQHFNGKLTLNELREMRDTGSHNWSDKAIITTIGTIHRINLRSR